MHPVCRPARGGRAALAPGFADTPHHTYHPPGDPRIGWVFRSAEEAEDGLLIMAVGAHRILPQAGGDRGDPYSHRVRSAALWRDRQPAIAGKPIATIAF